MMRPLVCVLASTAAWAGQSLASGSNVSATVPFRPNGQPVRLEFHVHGIGSTPSGFILQAGPYGLEAQITSARALVVGTRSSATCNISLDSIGITTELLGRMTIRGGAFPAVICEVWRPDGKVAERRAMPWTDLGAGGGTTASSNPTNYSIAFVRVHSTEAAEPHRPPLTVDNTDRLLEWKFENNLNDSSGNGLNASGTANYAASPTPAVHAIAKVAGGTRLLPRSPCIAGQACELASIGGSMADGSAATTCTWQQISGPPARPTSPNSCTTSITAPVRTPLTDTAGYMYRLTVTDGSATATADVRVGVVATYANGLVALPHEKLDRFLYPMRPAGQSPYAKLEEAMWRLSSSAHGRMIGSTGYGEDMPDFARFADGTVSHWIGLSAASRRTETTANLTTTSTTIPVSAAQNLNLTEFPTMVYLGPVWGAAAEAVLICASSATSGAANLTVCPLGRGVAAPRVSGDAAAAAATAWASATAVWRVDIQGSGANFVSGTNPLCPAGAPGPVGGVEWTGTVSVTSGSATITGPGGWSFTPNAWANYQPWKVRFEFAIGGQPVVWWAYINSRDSGTSITLDRPVPAGLDATTGITAHVIRDAHLSAEYGMVNTPSGLVLSGRGNIAMWGAACTSATQVHGIQRYDMSLSGLDNTLQSGMRIATWRGINVYGDFSATFYAPDLGAIAQSVRSGEPEGTAIARRLCGWSMNHPEAVGGGIILYLGGPVLTAMACAEIFPDNPVTWSHIRRSIDRPAPTGCNQIDARELGYLVWWWAIAADLDPDSNMRNRWSTRLESTRVVLTGCRRADNSYSNATYWTDVHPEVTLTNGQISGSGGTASQCNGLAAGTGTATAGSATLTGTGFVSGNGGIIVSSVATGKYVWLHYTFVSSTQVTLSAQWPGGSDYPTGAVRWMITAQDGPNAGSTITAFGQNFDSVSLDSQFACMFSAGTTTLDRPWPYASGNYRPYRGNVAGRAQQSFTSGIFLQGMNRARERNALWLEEQTRLSQWLATDAYNSATKIFRYAVSESSRPLNLVDVGLFPWRNPEQVPGLRSDAQQVWGDLTVESAAGLGPRLRTSPDATVQATMTESTRTFWCSPFDATAADCPFNTGATYFFNSAISNVGFPARFGNCYMDAPCTDTGGPKYYGFVGGVGAAYALGTESLAPPAPATGTAIIAYHSSAAWRASGGVSRIAPSGEVITSACSSSPCTISYDSRLGSLGLLR